MLQEKRNTKRMSEVATVYTIEARSAKATTPHLRASGAAQTALTLFILAAAVNLLGSLWEDVHTAHPDVVRSCPDIVFYISKPLLMPLLALWFFLQTKSYEKTDIPPLLIYLALLLSLAGDVLLMLPPRLPTRYFVYGMVAFLVVHVLYSVAFTRAVPLLDIVRSEKVYYSLPLFVYGYIIYSSIHGSIHPGFMVPAVLVYMLALLWNGFASISRRITFDASSSTSILVGVALFVESDSIIAVTNFEIALPLSNFAIMSTYIVGVFFIINGCVMRTREFVGGKFDGQE